MIERKRYWILPEFQLRMIKQWLILVILTTLTSNALTLLFVWHQDKKYAGKLFFVSNPTDTLVVNPTALVHSDIILPTLLIALALGCIFSMAAGVFYSHRLAGPIYHIRKTLREALDGKAPGPIVLRKNDEFKELAEDINLLLARSGGKS
ncbi:MAG: hypothetical protein WC881_06500 [Elusimicrobiota bacterium]|jgi:hypothetical protein